jgi:hypothetical protein
VGLLMRSPIHITSILAPFEAVPLSRSFFTADFEVHAKQPSNTAAMAASCAHEFLGFAKVFILPPLFFPQLLRVI